jgi:hypothetical protein
MIEHQRKIVHKHARIEITTQIYVKSGNTETEGEGLPPSFSTNDSDTILAWRRCPTLVFLLLIHTGGIAKGYIPFIRSGRIDENGWVRFEKSDPILKIHRFGSGGQTNKYHA